MPTVGLELMTPNQESDAPPTEPAWYPQNVFILERKNQVSQWLHSFLSELGDTLTAPSLAQTELEQQPPQTPLPDRTGHWGKSVGGVTSCDVQFGNLTVECDLAF